VRVLLTGADGQLAAELIRVFMPPAFDLVALDRRALNITDGAAVDCIMEEYAPELILNTAAYNYVDAAEHEPELAFAVNALGPRNLARAAHARTGTILVHYSTDYVFDGTADTPYTESDVPLPLSAYGVSKLAGEHFVLAEAPHSSYILRVSTVFGAAGQATQAGNFVERMLSLAAVGRHLRVVADQTVCPTYAPDIARVTKELVTGRHPLMLYHCVGTGSCSWYEFAVAIFAEAGVTPSLEPTTAAAYAAPARRPARAVLDTAHLASTGVAPPMPWRAALHSYFRARGG